MLAAALLTFLDASGRASPVRRLLGRRASQNVVSWQETVKPGALVLVAHLDAGRSGFAFRPGPQAALARLGRLLHRPFGPLEPFFWALLALLMCCLLRVAGLEGAALTATQLVPTVGLMVAMALLLDIALSPTVAGANDNASGVALALGLVERFGGRLEHFELQLVLTGAQEALAAGMRSFLRRGGRELRRERTVFVNLDEVGAGGVRYTRREGPLLALRSHDRLVRLCDDIAEDQDDDGARALVNRSPSDGCAARAAGFPALTVTCRDDAGLAAHHHRRSDTAERIEPTSLDRAEDFCAELIQRLDTELGPDLSGS